MLSHKSSNKVWTIGYIYLIIWIRICNIGKTRIRQIPMLELAHMMLIIYGKTHAAWTSGITVRLALNNILDCKRQLRLYWQIFINTSWSFVVKSIIIVIVIISVMLVRTRLFQKLYVFGGNRIPWLTSTCNGTLKYTFNSFGHFEWTMGVLSVAVPDPAPFPTGGACCYCVVSIEFSLLSSVELTNSWYQLHCTIEITQ